MSEYIKWYDLIPEERKVIFKNYYSDISVLDNISICGLSMNAIGVSSIDIGCDLPYPDKDMPRWRAKGYNTASTGLKFYDIKDFGIFVKKTCDIDGPITPIEIKRINDKLLEVKLENDYFSLYVKFQYLHMSQIDGYNTQSAIALSEIGKLKETNHRIYNKDTKWYDLLSDEDRKKLAEYYNNFSTIDKVVCGHISMWSSGYCNFYIRCYLPYPDKKIDKWEGTQYNEVSIYLKFHNIKDFHTSGIDTGKDGSMHLPIEVKVIDNDILEISIKNINQQLSFKYTRSSNLYIYDISDE
ncbi:MAG: hypothetical protein EOP34_06875, partial [Rickettsiales bacterium]